MDQQLMISVGDLLALLFWISVPAVALWQWYTNPHRPTKKRRR